MSGFIALIIRQISIGELSGNLPVSFEVAQHRSQEESRPCGFCGLLWRADGSASLSIKPASDTASQGTPVIQPLTFADNHALENDTLHEQQCDASQYLEAPLSSPVSRSSLACELQEIEASGLGNGPYSFLICLNAIDMHNLCGCPIRGKESMLGMKIMAHGVKIPYAI